MKTLKIYTVRSSKKNFDKLSVVLNDDSENGTRKTLNFMGKGSIKLAMNNKEDNDSEMELFHPFNDYIEIAMSDDQRQELFDLYSAAADIIENNDFQSYEKELTKIEPIFHAVIDLVKPMNLLNFFEHSSKYMVIPKDLKKSPGHGYYPAETTFLVEDYIELAKTTYLLRVAFPIFFGLLHRMESMTGQNYAELICGALIGRNKYITETKGWKRLRGYVTHSFLKNGASAQSITIDSSEYVAKMILYRIVFNRLSVSMLPETEPGKSIINAISSEVKQFENNNNSYRKKESYGDDDDNSSFIDEHQLTEDVPMVKITQMAEYFSFGLKDEKEQDRYKDRFKYQCMGFGIKNESLIEAVYDRLPTVWAFELTKPMKTLLQMVFAGDISERLYISCDYLQLTAAIALAQVKLSEMGYIHLSSLACAQVNKTQHSSGNSYLQLSADDRELLNGLCDVQSKNNDGGSFNEAVLFVKDFFEDLESKQWTSNLEFGVLGNPEIYSKVKRGDMFDIEIGVEIKAEFLDLVKHINQ